MIKTIQTESIWHGGAITREMYDELQDSFVQSAERIATDARSLVNLGPGDPAHLRDTIRAKGRKKERAVERIARGLARGEYEKALPGAWVFAGDRELGVYWAHMVEYGTYDSPANPFLRPAVDKNFNPTIAEAERAGRRVTNRRRRTRARNRRLAAGGVR